MTVPEGRGGMRSPSSKRDVKYILTIMHMIPENYDVESTVALFLSPSVRPENYRRRAENLRHNDETEDSADDSQGGKNPCIAPC